MSGSRPDWPAPDIDRQVLYVFQRAIAYGFQEYSGKRAISKLKRIEGEIYDLEKMMSLDERGVDSGMSFEYNEKNVCVNVYLDQYTRFS